MNCKIYSTNSSVINRTIWKGNHINKIRINEYYICFKIKLIFNYNVALKLYTIIINYFNGVILNSNGNPNTIDLGMTI